MTSRWSGFVQGTNRGKLFIRLKEFDNAITGDILFKDATGGAAIIRAKGTKNSNQITVDLFDFLFASPLPLEPQTGHISVTISENGNEISGSWVTDIGTKGQCRLFKTNFFRVLLLSAPFLYRLLLKLKRGFITKLKYIYLLLLLCLVTAPVIGRLNGKIGITELIIFLIPLILLFKNEIRDFFVITGLRKIGPVEFQDQSTTPVGLAPETIVQHINSLSTEYGEKFSLFVYLNRLFVPRTKAILQMLAAEPFPVTRQYFDNLARSMGVGEENNIQATYNVLIQNGCLRIDQDGNIRITDIGHNFLQFMNSFNQLFSVA